MSETRPRQMGECGARYQRARARCHFQGILCVSVDAMGVKPLIARSSRSRERPPYFSSSTKEMKRSATDRSRPAAGYQGKAAGYMYLVSVCRLHIHAVLCRTLLGAARADRSPFPLRAPRTFSTQIPLPHHTTSRLLCCLMQALVGTDNYNMIPGANAIPTCRRITE